MCTCMTVSDLEFVAASAEALVVISIEVLRPYNTSCRYILPNFTMFRSVTVSTTPLSPNLSLTMLALTLE